MQDYHQLAAGTVWAATRNSWSADKAGILSRLGIASPSSRERRSRLAEEELFSGKIDMICGNHITTLYLGGPGKAMFAWLHE